MARILAFRNIEATSLFVEIGLFSSRLLKKDRFSFDYHVE
jgi:hypothetical protein